MTTRTRATVLVAVVVLVVLVVGVVVYRDTLDSRAERSTPTDVAVADVGAFDGGPRIVFRSTAPGDLFGRVSVVALDDPAGPRDVTPAACDRVDAVDGRASCLRTHRGIATTFSADVLDEDWATVASWPLPGIPSRTRLSDDGTRVATTSFVTGHSYATTGFSTATEIHALDDDGGAEGLGNIEEYTVLLDGEPVAPVDRNMWGVTFVDDTTFYATTQSRTLGKTWLVLGDTTVRTLTVVTEGVECPSLSPDGTRIAYKADTDPGDAVHWSPAVLEISTGDVRVLDGELRSIDDQIEWLDDRTVLYGMPRTDQAGVTDVWSLDLAPDAAPSVLVHEAWSPAVIR